MGNKRKENYGNELQNVSSQLSPNYKIPNIQFTDLFTISTIKTENENTTLSIEINIPVVQREFF